MTDNKKSPASKPQAVKPTAKAQETAKTPEQPTVRPESTKDPKDIEQKQDILVPEEDQAIQAAKKQTTDGNPQDGMDDSPESKKIIKEHDQLVKDIEEGKVNMTGETLATDISTIKKPLVPHPLSGRPVYESQEAWLKAEGAKGNL